MEGFSLKGVKGALLGYCLMLIILVLVVAVGQSILSAVGVTPESNTFVAISGCFSIIAIIITLVIFCTSANTTIKGFLQEKRTNFIFYILAIVLSLSMFFGVGFLNTVVVNLLQKIGINTTSLTLNINSFASLVVFLVVYAILPAVFEELFFRKYMLSQMQGVGKVLSIILVSLAFALYHLSLAQFIYQFIYGVFLALLTSRSRSVLPATLAHFVNNASIIVMQYLSIQINLFAPVTIAIGLALLVVFVFGVLKVKND